MGYNTFIEYLPSRKGAHYIWQLKEFGVSLGDLIHEFNFEVVYGPEGFEKTEITKDDVNRLTLAGGLFDYFDPNRIQIVKGRIQLCRADGFRGAVCLL